jgi:hypothetical protein
MAASFPRIAGGSCPRKPWRLLGRCASRSGRYLPWVAAPKPAHRPRLPFELIAGERVISVAQAAAVFRERTGRDLATDQVLGLLLHLVASGLRANARGDRRDVVADPTRPGGVRWIELGAARGRPVLAPPLVRAVSALVDELRPADAALAMLLVGLDRCREFPVASVPMRGRGRDVQVVLRRLERWLSNTARKVERLPTGAPETPHASATATRLPAADRGVCRRRVS